jgi:hypothetical protein
VSVLIDFWVSGDFFLEVWFERMAAIPGIRFDGSPGIDRALLPESRIRPRASMEYLMWPAADGATTSASPASRHLGSGTSRLQHEELIRSVWEGLELPGTTSDYHFLLQGAVTELWSRRRREPAGLRMAETFGYLDLALLEAVPRTSLERLVSLLEREGALREALALSRRALRFGDLYRREDLEAKVAALDEELR